jgi:hypothetical protein
MCLGILVILLAYYLEILSQEKILSQQMCDTQKESVVSALMYTSMLE